MYKATTVQENHFRTIPTTREINHHITQVIEEDHQNEEIHKICHKNHYNRPNSRNNYSRSNSNTTQFVILDLIPNQGIDTIQTISHETHHIIGIETTPIIEIEVIQTIEIRITRTIDQGITHITDQTITDQTIIIKIDQETIHKIDIQVIIIVIEIIPNHHTEIIIIITIPTIATEVVHLNIKDI